MGSVVVGVGGDACQSIGDTASPSGGTAYFPCGVTRRIVVGEVRCCGAWDTAPVPYDGRAEIFVSLEGDRGGPIGEEVAFEVLAIAVLVAPCSGGGEAYIESVAGALMKSVIATPEVGVTRSWYEGGPLQALDSCDGILVFWGMVGIELCEAVEEWDDTCHIGGVGARDASAKGVVECIGATYDFEVGVTHELREDVELLRRDGVGGAAHHEGNGGDAVGERFAVAEDVELLAVLEQGVVVLDAFTGGTFERLIDLVDGEFKHLLVAKKACPVNPMRGDVDFVGAFAEGTFDIGTTSDLDVAVDEFGFERVGKGLRRGA